VITHSTFKRLQVDARARRHDAGEQHLGLALRTGGALNFNERNDGRKEFRLGHDASMMGTNVLFQVPDSVFNIAQLLKYMELGKCCLSGTVAFFENI
jgi:hypothetical protein